jgi:NAD+ synthetase
VKLALVQFNPTVGALGSNAEAIVSRAREAQESGADLVVFPECALTGYPPRDLLLERGFMEDVREAALRVARELAGAGTVVVGSPWRPAELGDTSGGAFEAGAPNTNALLVMEGGAITHRYDKRLLPTYDVFDEDRYFVPGVLPVVIEVAGVRVGLSVCEDLWRGEDAGNAMRYMDRPDPVEALVREGAQLIVNASASPFVIGKARSQRDLLISHVKEHSVAVAAVNQVGANDDLIFDGHASAYVPMNGGAKQIASGPGFEESCVMLELSGEPSSWAMLPEVSDPRMEACEEELLFKALVTGVRDYAHKSGFSRVCLGISGGIDSALTAVIAARALGPENVIGIMMPSRYSSAGSVTDAEALAQSLGIRAHEAPIKEMHDASEATLDRLFADMGIEKSEGITEENVQSRLRGLITMAVSNKTGAMLLTTGNKSELAVGYCTLYGDMNGGLAVLSDVTKSRVFAVSRWINEHADEIGFDRAPIPVSSIEKPPSAELRPDQKDEDTLPTYDVLDEIVERHVNRREPLEAIIEALDADAQEVARVVRLIDLNEYKRKQLAVGLKVTSVAFGRGRRRAIVQRYRPDLKVPST